MLEDTVPNTLTLLMECTHINITSALIVASKYVGVQKHTKHVTHDT